MQLRYRRLVSTAALAALAWLPLADRGRAQEPSPPEEIRSRVEKLEKELADLKEKSPTPSPEKPNEKGSEPKDSPKIDKPDEKLTNLIPGQDRKLTVSWDTKGFTFKSADGDFVGHIGGRLMTDEVWFTQSPQLRASPVLPLNSPLRLQTGVGLGIGDLQDGFFVRRARFVSDGTIYRMIEYKVEFDFENYNSISFDESYVGAKNLPYFDAIRIGQMHVPFGLEAYTTSRFLPMMERSPLFDAFYQEFAPGIFTNMTFLDQRVTAQSMFHRVDAFNQFNGASFGDLPTSGGTAHRRSISTAAAFLSRHRSE
jgi:phosphate-selective porin O/P